MIGWIVKPKTIREHTNKISYFRIGSWWDIIIKFLTPAMLIYMLIQSFFGEIKSPYGGYPLVALLLYGWCSIAIGIIGALIITKRPWREKKIEE